MERRPETLLVAEAEAHQRHAAQRHAPGQARARVQTPVVGAAVAEVVSVSVAEVVGRFRFREVVGAPVTDASVET